MFSVKFQETFSVKFQEPPPPPNWVGHSSQLSIATQTEKYESK